MWPLRFAARNYPDAKRGRRRAGTVPDRSGSWKAPRLDGETPRSRSTAHEPVEARMTARLPMFDVEGTFVDCVREILVCWQSAFHSLDTNFR
jgi:hypothetical protein